jgi:non-specific serine/threonine protein kinase/serine/threonine-protein kinase
VDRTAEAEALLALALEFPAAERNHFLDAACGGDPDLRGEIGALLLHSEGDPDFLRSPLLAPPEGANERDGMPPGDTIEEGTAHSSRLPRQIGGYTVLGILGNGGMGVVYEAYQSHPERSVALKLPCLGPATPALLSRFAREVQLLGRLRHPGIVQLLGVGRHQFTDRGGFRYVLPFMIMERVRGQRLDGYVSESAPALADRLRLFARICDAVHFAHQEGVVHRDLKPANILVQRDAQSKILDFGVAFASDGTPLTNNGDLLGSLAYMSPEQLGGAPCQVDARSDLYALGAILYGLLTGRLPFEIGQLSPLAAADLVRSCHPAFLSSLRHTLESGLAAIVGRAMAWDRDRRYRSAADLAADVRSYEAGEHFVARSKSLRAWLRRLTARR